MTKDEAMELLDNLIGMVSDSQDNDYDTALKMAIEALKQNQWIPCSERLPKEGKDVLVTVWGRCEVASYNCASDGLQAWEFDEFSLDNEDFVDVTAWMPLPEPYEGRTE